MVNEIFLRRPGLYVTKRSCRVHKIIISILLIILLIRLFNQTTTKLIKSIIMVELNSVIFIENPYYLILRIFAA